MTPKDEGMRWWSAQITAKRWVGLADALPSTAAVQWLERSRLLITALDGAAWVVRADNGLDDEAVLRQAYWPLVGALLHTYTPAALDRVSALRAIVGEATVPPTLTVRHAKNRTERTYTILPGHRIHVLPLDPDIPPALAGLDGHAREIPVAGGRLRVTADGWLLLALTLDDIRENLALVGVWLRSVRARTEDLEATYAAIRRPILFKRMGEMAAQAGNPLLAEQITSVRQALGEPKLSRSKTRTGQILLPASVTSAPAGREPWLDRLAERIARFAAELTDAGIGKGERHARDRQALLTFARQAKREDTYHSTTIEGYGITPEEVDAVLNGRALEPTTREQLERRMAIIGYAKAFDRTLEVLRVARDPVPLNELLILDLYEALWWPSVEAGFLAADEARRYRSRPAFIRDSRHVPPGPEKVPAMVRLLCEVVNDLDVRPVVRAALAHWAFEHVHPFPDGNGRVGRLLLNVVLGSAGEPWVTIRASERDAYFTALEAASVREDPLSWGQFLAGATQRARIVLALRSV